MAWGYTMERIGRRKGLAMGQAVGVAGSAAAGIAVITRSFPLFLTGLVLMGMARASADLGRFAAAEVYLPAERGRAISRVVLGGTVGSVVGPLLVGPTGHASLGIGFPELAGPYGVGIMVWALAGILVFAGLRPDPRDVGRELARLSPHTFPHPDRIRPLAEILRQPGVIVAMVTVVFAQMVMVMLMVMTAVHMKVQHHPLTALSLVIAVHTFGMYALAIISGRLTDRWGRSPVIILGSVVIIFSCLLAAPSTSLLPLAIALFLLGLGWNFAYVAGSTMLSDQLSPMERAKTQGFNDLLLGFASAAGSFGSGLIFSGGGYGTLALIAASAALIPLGLAVWWQVRGRLKPEQGS
jgi:MFS family permease